MTLERTQETTDFLSPYSFIWEIEKSAAINENSEQVTETSSNQDQTINNPNTAESTSSIVDSKSASNTTSISDPNHLQNQIASASQISKPTIAEQPLKKVTPSALLTNTNLKSETESSDNVNYAANQDSTNPTEEVIQFGNLPTPGNARSGAVETTGTLKIIKNEASGSFDVIISNADTPEGIEEVKVPVWSATGGQDDVQWYTAKKQLDNTYKAVVSVSNHKNDIGEYYIHLYYVNRKNQLIGVGGTTTTISKTATQPTGTMTIANVNAVTGDFDVVVSNVYAPNGLSQMLIPVWSETGGQDDIQWYTARRQTDGTYKISVSPVNHKNHTGTYHAHLYYRETSGKLTGIGGVTTSVSQSPVSGKITITNKNNKLGTFDIVVTEVASAGGITEILVPVWGDPNGQNDMKWYSASRQSDGTYKVSVKASDHQFETGTYHAHLYYKQNNGQLKGLGGTTTHVQTQLNSGKINIVNQNNQSGSFDVIISDISTSFELKEIVVPIWSDKGGQDDIQWYTATRQSDGNYKVSVSISNHQFNTGIYNIHLYYRASNGQLTGIGGRTLKVDASASQPTGSLSIEKTTTGFDVVVNDVHSPNGLANIYVPVWSDTGGQDDIQWYVATKQANGTYRASVNTSSQHGNVSGKYHVHLYYSLPNGQMIGIGGTSTEVTGQKANTGVSASYQGTGLYTLDFKNIYGAGVLNVAVWSDTGGQDDIRWYQASPLGNGRYSLNFNVQDHANTGIYHVHAYLTANGQHTFQAATTINVTRNNYEAPYYSQSDSRWGGVVYGNYNISFSGCVPAVVAMAASGIKGKIVTPIDVANYLYHSTQEFNKTHGAGTTAAGLIKAANHWGVKTSALQSQHAVVQALQNGYYVAAAIGDSVFVKSPTTHEIILKGYQNGKTYVMDPYTPSRNGWYDVSYLWSISSTWYGDIYQGTTFIQLSE